MGMGLLLIACILICGYRGTQTSAAELWFMALRFGSVSKFGSLCGSPSMFLGHSAIMQASQHLRPSCNSTIPERPYGVKRNNCFKPIH